MLVHKVEPYLDSPADMGKRPKFYFYDPGVLNGLLDNFSVSADRIGTLFEHAVINQLMNSAKANDKKIKVYYFRTRGGLEVDFIVEIHGKIFAVEVKSGTVNSSEVKKILQIGDYIPKIADYFMVTPDPLTRVNQGVKICGLNHFIQKLGL